MLACTLVQVQKEQADLDCGIRCFSPPISRKYEQIIQFDQLVHDVICGFRRFLPTPRFGPFPP